MMTVNFDQGLEKKLADKLFFLYGKNKGAKVLARLLKILEDFSSQYGDMLENKRLSSLSEKDIVLITYGDLVKEEGVKPLKTLQTFLNKYFQDTVSIVHILPFFPYSSDDGFSVIDYTKVNPELGDWEDIAALGQNFELMFDAVINHISAKSEWFKNYQAGYPPYTNYFIEVEPETDLSQVTRPRARPLLTPVETSRGTKYVWTTFSPDQVDLNYENEEVLLEIIKVLLTYVARGARIIRLDAIAYLWKKIGTSCIHLEETHKVIQLFRTIFQAVAPHVLILTETNVPHAENISYFGDGSNEAQMVYQFTLPPLLLHTFATGDASKLSSWANSLQPLSRETSFFNFLASHDGIGVRPVEGILSPGEIEALTTRVKEHGGDISYKTNSDGSLSPYELNITYFDAIVDENEPQEIQVDKFIASQAIMLALQGVPGIYLHSLLASRNYQEGVIKTGEKRAINREKLWRNQLEKELNDPDSLRGQVYRKYSQLLKIRRQEKAFHPNASQQVLFLAQDLFALLRIAEEGREKIIALHNVRGQKKELIIDLEEVGMATANQIKDLLSQREYHLTGKKLKIALRPYQVCWLKVN